MYILENRLQAGQILGEKLCELNIALKDVVVLGIPRGGVAVGYSLSKILNCSRDAIIVRKLPVPESPEVGFGAVTLDKTVILNKDLAQRINLPGPQIDAITEKVYKEVLRRNEVYRGNKEFLPLQGRCAIIVDDGLATGYTMLAAVEFARKKNADKVIAVSPVAHREAYNLVRKRVDNIVVLHISDAPYFAVASFYEDFSEMEDSEVISYLKDSSK